MICVTACSVCLVLATLSLQPLEKAMGLKYDPDGFIWDRRLRPYTDPIESTMFDPMHTWLTSGGIAQYHVILTAFCMALLLTRIVHYKHLSGFSFRIHMLSTSVAMYNFCEDEIGE